MSPGVHGINSKWKGSFKNTWGYVTVIFHVSSIAEPKVNRQCHRSSVTTVERIMCAFVCSTMCSWAGVHIPLVSLVLEILSESDALFGITKLFLWPEKAADVVTFETQHKERLWFSVYATRQSATSGLSSVSWLTALHNEAGLSL